jgi:hypothetical protein
MTRLVALRQLSKKAMKMVDRVKRKFFGRR